MFGLSIVVVSNDQSRLITSKTKVFVYICMCTVCMYLLRIYKFTHTVYILTIFTNVYIYNVQHIMVSTKI